MSTPAAILISIGVSVALIILGVVLIRPHKAKVPKIDKRPDHVQDIGQIYENLHKANINTKFDYNKRTEET